MRNYIRALQNQHQLAAVCNSSHIGWRVPCPAKAAARSPVTPVCGQHHAAAVCIIVHCRLCCVTRVPHLTLHHSIGALGPRVHHCINCATCHRKRHGPMSNRQAMRYTTGLRLPAQTIQAKVAPAGERARSTAQLGGRLRVPAPPTWRAKKCARCIHLRQQKAWHRVSITVCSRHLTKLLDRLTCRCWEEAA